MLAPKNTDEKDRGHLKHVTIGYGLSPRTTAANSLLVKAVMLAIVRKVNVNQQSTVSSEKQSSVRSQAPRCFQHRPRKKPRVWDIRSLEAICDGGQEWTVHLHHNLHGLSFATICIKMETLFALIPSHQATVRGRR